MNKRDDFTFVVEASVNGRRTVVISTNLINNSPNDYFISGDVIWVNGFRGGLPFVIDGPSHITCHISTLHRREASLIEIKANATISNTLYLHSYCDLYSANNGNYLIRFSTAAYLYTQDNQNSYYTKVRDSVNEYINLSSGTNFTLMNDEQHKYSPISGSTVQASSDEAM